MEDRICLDFDQLAGTDSISATDKARIEFVATTYKRAALFLI